MKQIWSDFRKLHIWMDEASQVQCPKHCNKCCTNSGIWLTIPELLKMLSYAEPSPQEHGCPFQRDGGCIAYEDRPILCRSYGPQQYLDQDMKVLTTTIGVTTYDLAGPGICDHIENSSCNVEEVNQIYECYSELSQYGLILIGSFKDPKMQIHHENICDKLQDTAPYEVYLRNANPRER